MFKNGAWRIPVPLVTRVKKKQIRNPKKLKWRNKNKKGARCLPVPLVDRVTGQLDGAREAQWGTWGQLPLCWGQSCFSLFLCLSIFLCLWGSWRQLPLCRGQQCLVLDLRSVFVFALSFFLYFLCLCFANCLGSMHNGPRQIGLFANLAANLAPPFLGRIYHY